MEHNHHDQKIKLVHWHPHDHMNQKERYMKSEQTHPLCFKKTQMKDQVDFQ